MGEGAEDGRGSPEGVAPAAATGLGHFIAEFKRRRVFRVLVAYGIFSFAVLQVIEPIMHGAHLGDWVLTAVLVALAVGFPVAVVLAWVFDLTAQGVTRTPSAAGPGAISLSRGRLALLLIGVGLVAALPGLGWYLLRPGGAPPPASGVVAPPAASTPSVAVLPFADLSPRHDQEYFADGMAEEILNALAQVEGLRVAGRTSAFAFKGKNEDLVAIAQKLRVGSILEGSVRLAGNRIRITAQLVNAADGFHVWSQTFDRELTGVFAIQDEIAQAVVAALRVKLLPDRAGPVRRQATNPEAYRLYLLARQAQALVTVASYDSAIVALREASRIAPEDARIQAQLASMVWSRWVLGADVDPRANAELQAWWKELLGARASAERAKTVALAMAEKAVALGPDLPEPYATRGFLRHMTGWDWAAARADLERALALAPGDVRTRTSYARLLATTGHVPEALDTMVRVTEDDPLWTGAWTWRAQFQSAAGRPEQAAVASGRGLELAPESAYLLRELGFALLLQGKGQEALAVAERHPITWFRHLLGAMAHHQLGNAEGSRQAMAQLEQGGDVWSYQIAQAHAWRGETDRAFAWLERGFATNDPGMRSGSYDPMLRSLRGDPRFKALLRKMNLPAL